MNLDRCVKCVEIVWLEILFVVCLSLIIESGISCEIGGVNDDCSICVWRERLSILFVPFDDDDDDRWCSLMVSIGRIDDGWWCSSWL